jgi:hypothetical protein
MLNAYEQSLYQDIFYDARRQGVPAKTCDSVASVVLRKELRDRLLKTPRKELNHLHPTLGHSVIAWQVVRGRKLADAVAVAEQESRAAIIASRPMVRRIKRAKAFEKAAIRLGSILHVGWIRRLRIKAFSRMQLPYLARERNAEWVGVTLF